MFQQKSVRRLEDYEGNNKDDNHSNNAGDEVNENADDKRDK